MFEFPVKRPSPRRTVLRLGEDMGLPQEERGLPRRGNIRQGELEDGFCGVSGPPRRGFACLGKPLRLGEGRLPLGEPVIALRSVFMACLGSISLPGL